MLWGGLAALCAEEMVVVSDPPTLQTRCAGKDVWRLGNTWIVAQPPDFQPDEPLQEGNETPRQKLSLKKSSELQSNFLGINTSGMPRSRETDYQPLEPVHLIDGNVETCWLSRGTRRPDMDPAWVRLDFPQEQTLTRMVFKKRPKGAERPFYTKLPVSNAVEVGEALPETMRVEGSSDGFTWQVLWEGNPNLPPEKREWTLDFPPTAAKSVRVVATRTVSTENYGYCFSISELEIYNAAGKNVALVSAGTGIIASSTEHGRNEIDMLRTLWPTMHEAGLKWVRIGYHDDPINWHEVERVQGVYEVDPVTDAAITELKRQGMEIIFCLNFGNRLYTDQRTALPDPTRQENTQRPFPQLWEWYYDSPHPPTTPEALAAWEKYVEFMVRKYRDRVRYFEVWNEWNIPLYWGDTVSVENYLNLAHRTIRLIRKLAPEAKVVIGSVSGFPWGCQHWNAEEWQRQERENARIRAFAELLSEVDVLGWHPYYQPRPEELLAYPADVRALQKWARGKGFQGEFMATEWNMSYNYPDFLPEDEAVLWRGKVRATEMEKAKYTAQCYVQDAGLGLVSFFCELHQPFYGALDLSLFRRTVDTDPVTTLQPQAAFYMIRNLATGMDGWKPMEMTYAVEGTFDSKLLRTYSFQTPKGKGLALWLGGKAADETARIPVDLRLPSEVTQVWAIDSLNGLRQELQFQTLEKEILVKKVRINDVPLLIEMECKENQ